MAMVCEFGRIRQIKSRDKKKKVGRQMTLVPVLQCLHPYCQKKVKDSMTGHLGTWFVVARS